jgi:hypothetical protein
VRILHRGVFRCRLKKRLYLKSRRRLIYRAPLNAGLHPLKEEESAKLLSVRKEVRNSRGVVQASKEGV